MLQFLKGRKVVGPRGGGPVAVQWEDFLRAGPEPDPGLAVITCFYNPCGYRRPVENWHLFQRYMAAQGLPLHTMELGFDGVFHLPAGERMTRVQSGAVLWHKERMLTALARSLPTEYRYVAAIDCDHFFAAEDWHRQAVALLETGSRAVQLFSEHHYTDERDRVDMTRASYAATRKGGYPPGGAWIYGRDFWEQHGLYDRLITGGGDVVAAYACTGDLGAEFFKRQGRVGAHAIPWMCRVYEAVAGRVGCVQTKAYHRWHGARVHRQYTDRTVLLEDYDPATDVRENGDGMLEWATDKPALQAGFRKYFTDRREDG